MSTERGSLGSSQHLDESTLARALVEVVAPPGVLARAERTVVEDCMRREGFEYEAPDTSTPHNGTMTLVGRSLSVEAARRDGYGFARMDSRVEPPLRQIDPRLRVQARFALEPPDSPRTYVALLGGREASAANDGCVAAGREAVYGSLADYLGLVYSPQLIRLEVLDKYEEAIRQPEVEAARVGYVDCMEQAGFHVTDPRDAWLQARTEFGKEPRVSSSQRRMSVADASCQTQTEVYEVASESLAIEARQTLIENAELIWTLGVIQRESFMRALEIEANHGNEV